MFWVIRPQLLEPLLLFCFACSFPFSFLPFIFFPCSTFLLPLCFRQGVNLLCGRRCLWLQTRPEWAAQAPAVSQRAAWGGAAWAPGVSSQRAAGRSRRSNFRLWCSSRRGLNSRANTTGRNFVGGLLLVPSDLISVLEHLIHDARVPSVAPQRVDLIAYVKRCDGRRCCDSCLLATAGARYHRAPPRSCPSIRLGKLPQATRMAPMAAWEDGRRGVQILEANRAVVHCYWYAAEPSLGVASKTRRETRRASVLAC